MGQKVSINHFFLVSSCTYDENSMFDIHYIFQLKIMENKETVLSKKL